MAYGKKTRKKNIFIALKIKLARMSVSGFPLNSVRVWSLRKCGFKIGKNVYISNGLTVTMFNSHTECDLVIEDRVAIAPGVTLILASDANWSHLNQVIPPVEGKILLKHDCWLGTGAVIMPDITIGEMSVVGAGSVVTHDVPPYTVVAGNPARVIKEIQL